MTRSTRAARVGQAIPMMIFPFCVVDSKLMETMAIMKVTTLDDEQYLKIVSTNTTDDMLTST